MNGNYLDKVTIDLDRTAHQWASTFAAKQTSVAKGRQVYLNTLAVCAVRQYLSCVCQLEIDLSQGDSWQFDLQTLTNVADLLIPNVGKLECLVALPNTTEIQLPPEALDDRIGYVVVQFSKELDRVQLLGFNPQVTSETHTLRIDRLQPLNNVLDLIYSIRIDNLRAMLMGSFQNGWEPIDRLNITTDREFALRNLISLPTNTTYDSIRNFTASKTIDLRANLDNIALLLLIGLSQHSDGRIEVRVRLHAAGGAPLLPAGVRLVLESADDRVLSEIQYPEPMNFIQLQSFKLQPETQFKITVALEESSFTESFVA